MDAEFEEIKWENYEINEKILKNLERLNFDAPTEIQSKVLTYVNSKVDLIVQARTGEGKTLCYGIPIVNYILNFYERAEDKVKRISPVALVLVPTRELGVQVSEHISEILKDLDIEVEKGKNKNYFNMRVVNVLGGFAKQKQLKILQKYKPEIVIATPGRLWELIENEETTFMNKINRLRFLVIDEADRMTEKGHFKELKNILDYVYTKIESDESLESDDEGKRNFKEKIDQVKNMANTNAEENNEKENEVIRKALRKKHGNIGKIETIDPMSMFENIDQDAADFNEFEENIDEENIDEENMDEEVIDEENFDEENLEENLDDGEENETEEVYKNYNNIKKLKKDEDKLMKSRGEGEKDKKKSLPSHRVALRTILCSATIEKLHTQNEKNNKKNKNNKNKNTDQKNNEKTDLDTLIKNLKFYNKLVYLKIKPENESTYDENDYDLVQRPNILPERLELDCYKCESTIKDYYLFHILRENLNKTIIVFTNSISHTKKLYSIFSLFDFNITVLHSKMQQGQRIKNLEKFKFKKSNVLFCTDVGARGLDIPLVDLIIHYHIPKTTEIFIHRSGRTARANKFGTAVSLISQAELNLYKRAMKDLKIKEFSMKTLNVSQLEKYKSLFEYGKKVEKEEHTIKKNQREKKWLQSRAKECDIELEEESGNEEHDEKESKMLNKKRRMFQKQNIDSKKVYHKIITAGVKRTSFLTPDLVQKLNSLMNDDKMKDLNLTDSIFNANKDMQSFKDKGKLRKKRYTSQRRKK